MVSFSLILVTILLFRDFIRRSRFQIPNHPFFSICQSTNRNPFPLSLQPPNFPLSHHPNPQKNPHSLTNTPLSSSPIQGTSDVRLDPQLNKKVWESGIKGVPFRLRVRISRKRNDEEGAKEKLYSYVQAVNVKSAKGLTTVVVEDS